MFKRFIEVFVCGPIFLLAILLNTVLVVTCIIWGPIYYIITGNDPMSEDTINFFFDKADKIKRFIIR
jgi:hypothetical protein